MPATRTTLLDAFTRIPSLTATIDLTADGRTTTVQVTYRRPGTWRIEDTTGLLVQHTADQHVARGSDGTLTSYPNEKTWYPQDEIGGLAWGHPDALLDATPAPLDPALDPPTTGTVAGRAVHREAFDMSSKRVVLTIDTSTGLVLAQTTRLTSRPTHTWATATVTHLHLDHPVPDHTFTPVPDTALAAVNRTALTQEQLRHGETFDETDDDSRTVVAAILRSGDRVLLCHRSPSRTWYPNVWDLPGGHVEPGETPTGALIRELREELGIRITRPTTHPVADLALGDLSLLIWQIDTWDGTVTNTAPDEHDDLAWTDLPTLTRLPLAHPHYLTLLTHALTT